MTLNADKLRQHQLVAAAHLLSVLHRNGATIDASDMGTGKTYVATAVAAMIDRPTLVVAPKISLTSWRNCAAYLDTSFSVNNYEMLRTGSTPFGWWDNNPPKGFEREEFFKCQCCQLPVDLDNWQPCYTHDRGIHCIETHKRKWKYGHFNWHHNIKFLIFDECHRCGALQGLNYEMLIAAKRQRILTLLMSATPATSPLGLKAIGYTLGLHGLNDFDKFAREHGCRFDRRFRGWKFLGSAGAQLGYMTCINSNLFPYRGVRVRKQDIPGFPKCHITAELYDLKENNRIDSLYDEMAIELEQLRQRRQRDLSPDAPVTKILRAREEVELLKVPVLVELAEDYVAKGFSIALFVNFSSVLRELRRRLCCDVYIDGTQTDRVRQMSIAAFQADKSPYIIANSKAGGISVSLHDLHGNRPRGGLVCPSFSAVDMQQDFGRLAREGGKSAAFYRVILAAGTVERQIHRNLATKLNNLDALTDADLMPDNLKL